MPSTTGSGSGSHRSSGAANRHASAGRGSSSSSPASFRQSELYTRCPVTASTPEPEGGAWCVSSARRDLCGGRGEILVPTATMGIAGHRPTILLYKQARGCILSSEHVDRRLAAILAADVAGSCRLIGIDEEGTLAQLKALRKTLFDPIITEHRGRIVTEMCRRFRYPDAQHLLRGAHNVTPTN